MLFNVFKIFSIEISYEEVLSWCHYWQSWLVGCGREGSTIMGEFISSRKIRVIVYDPM